jgi:hypothetical protein
MSLGATGNPWEMTDATCTVVTIRSGFTGESHVRSEEEFLINGLQNNVAANIRSECRTADFGGGPLPVQTEPLIFSTPRENKKPAFTAR